MADNPNMLMGKNSTIEEYIDDFHAEDIVSSAYFLKQIFTIQNGKKVVVNFQNLITKYFPELNAIKNKVTLTSQEYSKYKYNPKLMSFDIYGTTELWFLILEANELHSVADFDLRTIYLYDASVVDKVVRILNLERDTKDYNEEELSLNLIG